MATIASSVYLDTTSEILKTRDKNGTLVPMGTVSSGVYTTSNPPDLTDALADILFLQSEKINVKAYGAVGDGVTDDTTALLNSITALPATGGILYIPKGTYVCTAQLLVSNKHIVIHGDGRKMTTLSFTSTSAGAAGIKVNQTEQETTHIIGLRVATTANQTTGNNAIEVNYANSFSKALLIRDIEIASPNSNSRTYYWNTGIRVVNGNDGNIEDFYIAGANGTPAAGGWTVGSNMFACIHLSGNSTVMRVQNGQGILGVHGIYMTGNTESVYIGRTDLYATTYGIYMDDDSSGDTSGIGYSAGIRVENSHGNQYKSYIVIKGHYGHIINNCIVLRRQDAASDYIAFDIREGTFSGGVAGTYGAANGIIMGHQINLSYPALAGSATVVKFSGVSSQWLVTNNQISNVSLVVNPTSTAGLYHATGNTWLGGGDPTLSWVENAGSSTIIEGNYPIHGPQVLTLNSTTPSVAGNQNSTGMAVSNANTPIVITDFTNGFIGQQLVIIFADTNSTIQHNTNISLAGGVNFVPGAGANTLTLLKTATGLWREIGRKV